MNGRTPGYLVTLLLVPRSGIPCRTRGTGVGTPGGHPSRWTCRASSGRDPKGSELPGELVAEIVGELERGALIVLRFFERVTTGFALGISLFLVGGITWQPPLPACPGCAILALDSIVPEGVRLSRVERFVESEIQENLGELGVGRRHTLDRRTRG